MRWMCVCARACVCVCVCVYPSEGLLWAWERRSYEVLNAGRGRGRGRGDLLERGAWRRGCRAADRRSFTGARASEQTRRLGIAIHTIEQNKQLCVQSGKRAYCHP